MSDFNNLNHLPPEVKILIVNGQSLVDRTRIAAKEKRLDIDLTAKVQLRDDCKAVEKRIKKLGKGKVSEKDIKDLELAIIRLKTTAGALVGVK